MKYPVGAIVYVTAELRRQGFSARTGEIIYKNPRQRLYTIRFPGDKRVRYFAEHEITLVPEAHRPRSWRPPSKSYKPDRFPQTPATRAAVIIGLVVLGLSYVASALNSNNTIVPPPPGPAASAAPGQPAPAPEPTQPVERVQYSNQNTTSRPNIRIALNPVNVTASSFTVAGQLINEGTVVTVNNVVTVIVYDRGSREISRQAFELGTLALQTAKPFSASFTGDPSVVGSYKVFKHCKFWPTGL